MLLIRKNDEYAFAELYDRYAAKLLRFFYRMLDRKEEKAQDLLHDLFVRLIENSEKYDDSQNFSPWIYRMATNLCKNELRNSGNRSRLVNESFRAEDAMEIDGYAEIMDKEALLIQIERVFADLKEEQRVLITLHFYEDISLRNIAQILEIPEGTVRSRLFYLLKKFSVSLHEFNPNK